MTVQKIHSAFNVKEIRTSRLCRSFRGHSEGTVCIDDTFGILENISLDNRARAGLRDTSKVLTVCSDVIRYEIEIYCC